MTNDQPPREFNLWRSLKKFFVSAFVVCTFVAYAVHERFAAPNQEIGASAATQVAIPTQRTLASPPATATAPRPLATAQPTAPPAATAPPTAIPATPASPAPSPMPAPTQAALGLYSDGSYTGAEVDAFYGLVQVQATIQQGKITAVEFLEYPNDRRTSVRINRIAMPYLTTEAIQAQSAEVDIISGATLTSEAFAQSLQTALDTARAKS
jgi:uncharacterized protein with FMN-binding domain